MLVAMAFMFRLLWPGEYSCVAFALRGHNRCSAALGVHVCQAGDAGKGILIIDMRSHLHGVLMGLQLPHIWHCAAGAEKEHIRVEPDGDIRPQVGRVVGTDTSLRRAFAML